MSHLDHFSGHANVVVVIGRCLAVFQQRTVHHHAGETVVDGRLASVGAVAVILVHHDRDVRVKFGCREHQVTQVSVLRVRSGTTRRLDDHRRISFLGRLHDRLDLFHVVDVEGGDAVIVLGCMIKDDAKRNQRHDGDLPEWSEWIGGA